MKKTIVTILILLLFPIQVFAYSNYIIPGGTNIGIEVYNKGIMVIGFYKINNKFNRVFVLVLDSLGVGASEDAFKYGDLNTTKPKITDKTT